MRLLNYAISKNDYNLPVLQMNTNNKITYLISNRPLSIDLSIIAEEMALKNLPELIPLYSSPSFDAETRIRFSDIHQTDSLQIIGRKKLCLPNIMPPQTLHPIVQIKIYKRNTCHC